MATATITAPHPFYLAGRWATSPDVLLVDDPANPGTPAGATYTATAEQYEQAVQGAIAGFERMRRLTSMERSRALHHVEQGLRARREEIGRIITSESGKPIRDALAEVDRAILTFKLGAEEAERIVGETIPLDLNPASKGRMGITRRFPIGPVAAISPFNFPLNLAAHKISPAIAAGCSIVLKPPSRDPLTMLAVAEIIDEAGLPEGAVSILPMDRETGDRLVEDDRFKLLTFTGSRSGLADEGTPGRKKVVLELGATRPAPSWMPARTSTGRCSGPHGCFSYAGQVCISVQRLFVHQSVWEPFMERFVEGARAITVGDPMDPETRLGPMVDLAAAQRIGGWVDEAVAAGARVLSGGKGEGQAFPPTVLVDVPRDAAVCQQEAFAPIVVVAPFDDFGAVLAEVNDSRFGLQAGLFTNDLGHAWQAFEELVVGGVIVNDVPTYRIDHMPYGGVKDSGLGREGLRWAIEDMTEVRILVLAPLS